MVALSDSISILEVPGFDVGDFHARWRRARLAVLARSVPEAAMAGERDCLARVAIEESEKLQKEVYLGSRRFGQSAVRHFGVVWDVDDLRIVLSGCPDVPCLAGTWSSMGPAARVSRPGCAERSGPSSVFCDYWREAIDGLVHGLCEDVAYARQSSAGHDEPTCADVFYPEHLPGMKWRPLPDDLRKDLDAVVLEFLVRKVALTFEGILENELHYRMKHDNGALCGASETLYKQMLERAIRKRAPGLRLKDASPGAVIR